MQHTMLVSLPKTPHLIISEMARRVFYGGLVGCSGSF